MSGNVEERGKLVSAKVAIGVHEAHLHFGWFWNTMRAIIVAVVPVVFMVITLKVLLPLSVENYRLGMITITVLLMLATVGLCWIVDTVFMALTGEPHREILKQIVYNYLDDEIDETLEASDGV